MRNIRDYIIVLLLCGICFLAGWKLMPKERVIAMPDHPENLQIVAKYDGLNPNHLQTLSRDNATLMALCQWLWNRNTDDQELNNIINVYAVDSFSKIKLGKKFDKGIGN